MRTNMSIDDAAMLAGWREHHRWLVSLGLEPPPRLLALLGLPVQTERAEGR
jgi:hypothetical protein